MFDGEVMREFTLVQSARLQAAEETVEETFLMDEESFRVFYEKTSRPLWSYLSRVSGDSALADDLLQESYYRFLRSKLPEMSEAHRRNYLFRIGTNLLRDHWRRGGERVRLGDAAGLDEASVVEHTAENVQRQSDLARVLIELKPRERELLWLAYVEGSSHKEIAETTGLKAESIRLLLFRARHKLAALLRKRGLAV